MREAFARHLLWLEKSPRIGMWAFTALRLVALAGPAFEKRFGECGLWWGIMKH